MISNVSLLRSNVGYDDISSGDSNYPVLAAYWSVVFDGLYRLLFPKKKTRTITAYLVWTMVDQGYKVDGTFIEQL